MQCNAGLHARLAASFTFAGIFSITAIYLQYSRFMLSCFCCSHRLQDFEPMNFQNIVPEKKQMTTYSKIWTQF